MLLKEHSFPVSQHELFEMSIGELNHFYRLIKPQPKTFRYLSFTLWEPRKDVFLGFDAFDFMDYPYWAVWKYFPYGRLNHILLINNFYRYQIVGLKTIDIQKMWFWLIQVKRKR